MGSVSLLNFNVAAYSCSYSADNSKLVLGGLNTITLYTTTSTSGGGAGGKGGFIITNCHTLVSSLCTACNSGYYLASFTSC